MLSGSDIFCGLVIEGALLSIICSLRKVAIMAFWSRKVCECICPVVHSRSFFSLLAKSRGLRKYYEYVIDLIIF